MVKALNTLFASYIAPNPHHPAARQILFYARDVAEAKTGFHKVFDDVGFTSIDIGGLRDGGRLMQVGGGPFSALHAPKED